MAPRTQGAGPMPSGLRVAQAYLILLPGQDVGDGSGNLPRHECLSAPRGLVVEQDAIGQAESVPISVVDGHPKSPYTLAQVYGGWR